MEQLFITRNQKTEVITIAQSLNPKAVPQDPRHLRRLLALRVTLGIKKEEAQDLHLSTLIRRCPNTRKYLESTYTFKHTAHLGLGSLIEFLA